MQDSTTSSTRIELNVVEVESAFGTHQKVIPKIFHFWLNFP